MILVTGGNGFIGSNYIHHVLSMKKNKEVIVNLDKHTDVSSDWIDDKYKSSDKYISLSGDINDIKNIGEHVDIESITHCMHFAAESHVDNSIDNIDPFIHSNISGTYAVGQFCATHNIKMIHISTDEVYGHLPLKSTHKCSTDSALKPRNPYSASKASAELMLGSIGNVYSGFRYAIVRPSNTYGPHQDDTKFIPKAIKCIKSGSPFPMYGNGEFYREWTNVADTCIQLEYVRVNSHSRSVFNITSNQSYSNLEMFIMIGDIMRRIDPSLKTQLEFITDPRGGAHDLRYAIENSFEGEKYIHIKDGLKTLIEGVLK